MLKIEISLVGLAGTINFVRMEHEQSRTQAQILKELRIIPGVGKSIAMDLWNIGIRSVADLKGRDPTRLYDESNQYAGMVQDRCLLYVFRCAVYFAETPQADHEPEKLKWWNWMDGKYGSYGVAWS